MNSKPYLTFLSPADLRDLPKSILQVEERVLEEQPLVEDQLIEQKLENTALLRQLQFLAKPFQQKVYQPLEIHCKDGTRLFGKIKAIEGQLVTIISENQTYTLKLEEITALYWQNKPFPAM